MHGCMHVSVYVDMHIANVYMQFTMLYCNIFFLLDN